MKYVKSAAIITVFFLLALLGIISAGPGYCIKGKGIFLFGAYPRGDDYGKDDPSVSGKELWFEWSEIEPEEGVYNWKLVDDLIKPWAEKGKTLALRISSTSNWGYSTPEWIFDKYSVPFIDASKMGGRDAVIYPVYWNSQFVSKYSDMVRELAKRYDGDPNIEYVQVGGVGRWEETYVHTDNEEMTREWQKFGYSHRSYIEHCKQMCRIFKKYFKKTPIVLSLSIGGPDAKTEDRTQIGYKLAEYAVAHNIWLKQNGMQSHYSYSDHDHFSRIFTSYIGRTKRLYEEGVPVTENGWDLSTFRSYINRALVDCPDYLWIYQVDLARPEFARDIKYAARHMAMKSYKDAGPLYIKFRQYKHYYENRKYNAVVEDQFYGLYNHYPRNPWPSGSLLQPATVGKRKCKITSPVYPYVYLDVEDSVITQESRGTNRISSGTMKITYFDRGGDSIFVQYNYNGTCFLNTITLKRTDTKRWKTSTVRLQDMKFETRLSVPENDFRIYAGSGRLAISRVELAFGS